MLEEEIKTAEVVEAEPVAVEPVAEPVDPREGERQKNALAAFIMSIIGFCLAWEPFVCLAGIILGAIALGKAKKGAEVEKQPHKTFVKVAKPVATVSLIAGIVMTLFWAIYGIIVLVGIIAAAVAGAGA